VSLVFCLCVASSFFFALFITMVDFGDDCSIILAFFAPGNGVNDVSSSWKMDVQLLIVTRFENSNLNPLSKVQLEEGLKDEKALWCPHLSTSTIVKKASESGLICSHQGLCAVTKAYDCFLSNPCFSLYFCSLEIVYI
jgi:hypothetical protein